MRRTVPLLIASLLLLLPSCAPANDFKGGRPITKEDLAAISEELFTTDTAPQDSETTAKPQDTVTTDKNQDSVTTDKPQDTEAADTQGQEDSDTTDTETSPSDSDHIVYWLSGGSVYHLDADCSHIAGKENVNQTTVQEAVESGRRLCKTCEKKHS